MNLFCTCVCFPSVCGMLACILAFRPLPALEPSAPSDVDASQHPDSRFHVCPGRERSEWDVFLLHVCSEKENPISSTEPVNKVYKLTHLLKSLVRLTDILRIARLGKHMEKKNCSQDLSKKTWLVIKHHLSHAKWEAVTAWFKSGGNCASYECERRCLAGSKSKISR